VHLHSRLLTPVKQGTCLNFDIATERLRMNEYGFVFTGYRLSSSESERLIHHHSPKEGVPNMKRIKSIACALAVSAGLSLAAETRVVTYTAPPEAKTSTDFTVTVNGQPLVVYKDVRYYFVNFSMQGTVAMTVNWTLPFTTAVVRPLSHGITPQVSGRSATFTFTGPRNITFESNDDQGRAYGDGRWPDDVPALLIFANPLEVNVPSPTDPSVQYYGPGYHEIGTYTVTDAKKTVYLAGGAYLHGRFHVRGVNDVLIFGRGILNSYDPNAGGPKQEEAAIFTQNCSGLRVQGITVTANGTWAWSTVFRGASQVVFDNYHIVSWIMWNDDGIQPRADYCVFNRCFSAVADDDYSYTGGSHQTYLNCVGRSGASRTFQIWYPASYGVYKGCEVIGPATRDGWPAILFEGGDQDQNFLFEDMNIEVSNQWLEANGPNHYFKDINVLNAGCGASAPNASNLVFENLRVGGKPVMSESDMNWLNGQATFKASDPTLPTVRIYSPTKYDSTDVVSGPSFTLRFTISNWSMTPGGKGFRWFVNGKDMGLRYTADPIEISGLPMGPNAVVMKLVDETVQYIRFMDGIVVTVVPQSVRALPGSFRALPLHAPAHAAGVYGFDGRKAAAGMPRTATPGVYLVKDACGGIRPVLRALGVQ
jgi:hypothetical protein